MSRLEVDGSRICKLKHPNNKLMARHLCKAEGDSRIGGSSLLVTKCKLLFSKASHIWWRCTPHQGNKITETAPIHSPLFWTKTSAYQTQSLEAQISVSVQHLFSLCWAGFSIVTWLWKCRSSITGNRIIFIFLVSLCETISSTAIIELISKHCSCSRSASEWGRAILQISFEALLCNVM